jgi:hypothetical protein
MVDLPSDRPCQAHFAFAQPVQTHRAGELLTVSELTVPLNGRKTSGVSASERIPLLAPGQRWYPPNETRGAYWAADPANTIAESDEGNNLHRVTNSPG